MDEHCDICPEDAVDPKSKGRLKARAGIQRISKGESVQSVLNALLLEMTYGDPEELDRLYGKDFTPSGKLRTTSGQSKDYTPASGSSAVEIPAFVRESLANHGYTHAGEDVQSRKWIAKWNPNDYTVHKYVHPEGIHMYVGMHRNPNFEMKWLHKPADAPPTAGKIGVGATDLVDRLKDYHG